jgi:hypothetical protein
MVCVAYVSTISNTHTKFYYWHFLPSVQQYEAHLHETDSAVLARSPR